MRSAIRVSALLLALGGCLGLVTAQHHAVAVDETVGLGSGHLSTIQAAIVDDYDSATGITGSIELAPVPRLSLSDEQRGFIFFGVINVPDVPDVDMSTPEPGVPLSETVELHEIPAMVLRRVPGVSGYRFVKLEDRILLVKPETRQVATTIPRYKLVFH